MFHGKDVQNLNYKVRFERVDVNQPRIKISTTETQTFTEKAANQSLKEFSVDKNDQPPLTQREQQCSRKKLLHMEFDRQSERKMGPQPERGMQDP